MEAHTISVGDYVVWNPKWEKGTMETTYSMLYCTHGPGPFLVLAVEQFGKNGSPTKFVTIRTPGPGTTGMVDVWFVPAPSGNGKRPAIGQPEQVLERLHAD